MIDGNEVVGRFFCCGRERKGGLEVGRIIWRVWGLGLRVWVV